MWETPQGLLGKAKSRFVYKSIGWEVPLFEYKTRLTLVRVTVPNLVPLDVTEMGRNKHRYL